VSHKKNVTTQHESNNLSAFTAHYFTKEVFLLPFPHMASQYVTCLKQWP